MRTVGRNIFNKQLRTADKGWFSSLGLGEMLTTPHSKNLSCYDIFTQQSSDKNEMGGACSAYGGEESRVQGFGGET